MSRRISFALCILVLCFSPLSRAEVLISTEKGAEQNIAQENITATNTAEAPFVDVFYVSGKVEVMASPDGYWKEATEGAILHSGDQIKTQADSSAEMAYDGDEDRVTRLDSDTHVAVILRDNDMLELMDGEVYSSVKNLTSGEAFEIKTAAGICGVRGTDWLTKFSQDTMDVEAYDDNLYVKNVEQDGSLATEATVISSGYKTRMARFERPSKPQMVPIQAMHKWNKWKGDLPQRIQKGNLRIRHPLRPGMRSGVSQQQGQLPQGTPQQIKPGTQPVKKIDRSKLQKLPVIKR